MKNKTDPEVGRPIRQSKRSKLCKHVVRILYNDPERLNCVHWCVNNLANDKFRIHMETLDDRSTEWVTVFEFLREIDLCMFRLSMNYKSLV